MFLFNCSKTFWIIFNKIFHRADNYISLKTNFGNICIISEWKRVVRFQTHKIKSNLNLLMMIFCSAFTISFFFFFFYSKSRSFTISLLKIASKNDYLLSKKFSLAQNHMQMHNNFKSNITIAFNYPSECDLLCIKYV